MINLWKKEFLERAPELFSKPEPDKQQDKDLNKLYAKIGLTVLLIVLLLQEFALLAIPCWRVVVIIPRLFLFLFFSISYANGFKELKS